MMPLSSKKTLLKVENISKRFNHHLVLESVSFEVFEGEVVTIIGKSGVGKSVLLKHMVGLLVPDNGRILYKGQPINEMNSREKDDFLCRVSYMFQNNALFSSLTVFENVAMPLQYRRNTAKKDIYGKVMDRLEQLELADSAQAYPAELSGGMQKRVALARTLITGPEIVLFDEPTTGQDPIRKNAILSMIAEYQQRFNFSAVLISHDLPDVYFISNRIVTLYEGRIIFEGTPEEFERFDHPFRLEWVQSLESLKQKLSGRYSQRHFKVRYQNELYRDLSAKTYVIAIVRLERMMEVNRKLGPALATNLSHTIGSLIHEHFSRIGGFSTRFGPDEFVTVLQHTDLAEARWLLEAFVENYFQNRIIHLQQSLTSEPECIENAEVTITLGFGEGKVQTDMNVVIEQARRNPSTIARFVVQCRKGTA